MVVAGPGGRGMTLGPYLARRPPTFSASDIPERDAPKPLEKNMTIRLAVLDMAGTTVADDGLVVRAFDEAATAVGLPASGPDRDDARRYVLDTMGQSKIVVFRALFGSDERARIANDAFERAYERFVDQATSPASPAPRRRSRSCVRPA